MSDKSFLLELGQLRETAVKNLTASFANLPKVTI